MDNNTAIEKATENAKEVVIQDGLMLTVRTAVHGISASRVLKGVAVIDDKGHNLSQESSVKRPSIQTLPNESLKFVKQAKDRVKAIFRRRGFDFGKETYCVSAAKAKEVYEELAFVRGEFESELSAFLDNYDELVEEQCLLNPDTAELIRAHAPKKEKIQKSFVFHIAPPRAIKVHAEAFAEIESIPGLDIDSETDSFTTDIVAAFCKEARHFWNNNAKQARLYFQDDEFRQKVDGGKGGGMKPTMIKHLKAMKAKLEDAELINPKVELLTRKVDDVIKQLPVSCDEDYKHLISGKDIFTAVLKSFALLKEEEYIFTLLEAGSEAEVLEENFIKVEMDLLEIDLELDSLQTAETLSAVNQPEFQQIDILGEFDLGLDVNADSSETKVEAAPAPVDIFDEAPVQAFDENTLSLDDLFADFM